VGLFYFGLACGHEVSSRRQVFAGSRQEIKAAAADTLLAWLLEYLEGLV
jgi:nicotinamide mononucleotide (NMN) deamidase PncC